MITGLAVDPRNDNIFVSVSDDQYVNIWEMKKLTLAANTLSVELVRSLHLDNKLCTGVCYMQDGNIGISCYEEEEITVVKR